MGPYREPAEDVEASLDELEVAAFKAALDRRARRARACVFLTVLGAVGLMAFLASLSFRTPRTIAASLGAHASRCETHLVRPSRGEPFPMTTCR